jgi:hypothetical protein
MNPEPHSEGLMAGSEDCGALVSSLQRLLPWLKTLDKVASPPPPLDAPIPHDGLAPRHRGH